MSLGRRWACGLGKRTAFSRILDRIWNPWKSLPSLCLGKCSYWVSGSNFYFGFLKIPEIFICSRKLRRNWVQEIQEFQKQSCCETATNDTLVAFSSLGTINCPWCVSGDSPLFRNLHHTSKYVLSLYKHFLKGWGICPCFLVFCRAT